jgi:2-amino-4-hydroxy-6-hydroxymethyldihydropteridine diphosphokinase
MAKRFPVYLALGTNLGRRQHNLKEALRRLPPEVEISAVSRLYETAPAYVVDQPPFFNIAVKAETGLSPTDLLAFLKELEAKIGRKESFRYGPRQIDLDIIFYDDRIVDLPNLTIPHPRLSERAFVLKPLADIAPSLIHPVLNKTIVQLLAELPSEEGILTVIDWQP